MSRLDLRSIAVSHRIEIDTPNAAFIVDHTGYYRVDVDADDDQLHHAPWRLHGDDARRPANSRSSRPASRWWSPAPSRRRCRRYVAPEVGHLGSLELPTVPSSPSTPRARSYVPPDVYGGDALDDYGNWRVVETYGPVWVPQGVASTWAPYSTGRWIWDPYYGWSWVDTAPWGWAPYHYGRWVHLGNYWGWAPGPRVGAPIYAPALVAFFGGSGVHVGYGAAPVGWVALGWGEPCVPWWGRPGFVGRPWWGGWGGPHVVNNTYIDNTTVVNVHDIHRYRNVGVRNGLVAVPHDHFGRDGVAQARLWNIDPHRLRPIHGPVPVQPSSASLVPASGRGVRPPDSVLQRRVVGTRPAHNPLPELHSAGLTIAPSGRTLEPRLVPAPQRERPSMGSARPPINPAGGSSSTLGREPPAARPRVQESAPQILAPRNQPARPGIPRPNHAAPPLLTNVGPGSEGARPVAPRPVAPRPDGPRPQRLVPPESHLGGARPMVLRPGVPTSINAPSARPAPPPPPIQAPSAAPLNTAPVRGGAPYVMPGRGVPEHRAPQHGAPPPPQVPQAQVPQAPQAQMPRVPQAHMPDAPQAHMPHAAPQAQPGVPANAPPQADNGGQPRQFGAPQHMPVAPFAPGMRGGGRIGR